MGETVKESKNANQQLNGVYRQIVKDMGNQKIFGKNSKIDKMEPQMSSKTPFLTKTRAENRLGVRK